MQSDQASPIRAGEELDKSGLSRHLHAHLPGFEGITELQQFPGGYSNLTYLLISGSQEYVLRRPPFGADIKSAHDMGREFRVLSLLEGHYPFAPKPLLSCEDPEVIGAPFYLMERVKGVILRPSRPPQPLPSPAAMRATSEAAVDNLARLHALDLRHTGLAELGKPEGYTRRQTEGWIARYAKAATEEIPAMAFLADWMMEHLPEEPAPSFIHNDYKYDNLILDPEDPGTIRAVLDWEMATVGNPLMDIGLSLVYWVEAGDSPALQLFNLTALPGNLSRKEALERYAEKSGRDVSGILFYYAFGTYKLSVIIQQIYARYVRGFTRDPRFAMLIHAVKACSAMGEKAVRLGRIYDLK
jgi:aminoglycoside phosphotransferase (APT) family kinase protein